MIQMMERRTVVQGPKPRREDGLSQKHRQFIHPSLYSDLCSDISGISFLNILPKIVPCLWITALLFFVIPFLSNITLNRHIFIKLLFVFYP